MKMAGNLLSLRNSMKKRKPTFVRQQYGYFPKLSREKKWRRPRGLQSKIAKKLKSRRRMPEVGYGSPRQVRGLDINGYREVVVTNVKELSHVNKKSDIVVIGRRVGNRKKVEILEEVKKKGLKVSNVKSVDDELGRIKKVSKKESKKGASSKSQEKKADQSKKSSGDSKESTGSDAGSKNTKSASTGSTSKSQGSEENTGNKEAEK